MSPQQEHTWESSRVTVQVLFLTAAALVTNTSNAKRAAPSAARLADCAAIGATAPVQFATWSDANETCHAQTPTADQPASAADSKEDRITEPCTTAT